jgi:hypothetical protein
MIKKVFQLLSLIAVYDDSYEINQRKVAEWDVLFWSLEQTREPAQELLAHPINRMI